MIPRSGAIKNIHIYHRGHLKNFEICFIKHFFHPANCIRILLSEHLSYWPKIFADKGIYASIKLEFFISLSLEVETKLQANLIFQNMKNAEKNITIRLRPTSELSKQTRML